MEVEKFAVPGGLKRIDEDPPPAFIQDIGPSGLRTESGGNIDLICRVFGNPLTKDQVKVWSAFLPTRYSLIGGRFKSYAFDTPPADVVEQIDTARGMGVFHDIQIWTPEGRFKDPMAVGVLRPNGTDSTVVLFFPIVRWAESLPSYRRIKWISRGIRSVRVMRGLVFASLFLGIIAAGVWLMYQTVAQITS